MSRACLAGTSLLIRPALFPLWCVGHRWRRRWRLVLGHVALQSRLDVGEQRFKTLVGGLQQAVVLAALSGAHEETRIEFPVVAKTRVGEDEERVQRPPLKWRSGRAGVGHVVEDAGEESV